MANKLRPEPMPSATNALMDAIGRFYENDGLAGLLGMTSVNRQIHDATQAQMNAPDIRSGVAAAAQNPMTMAIGPATIKGYHATQTPFSVFDPSKYGSATDGGQLGRGAYFSSDRAVGRNKPVTLEANLDLKNPLRVALPDFRTDKQKVVRDALNLPSSATPEQVTAAAQARGHDGVILDYSPTGYNHQEMAVFDPSRISIMNSGAGSGIGKTVNVHGHDLPLNGDGTVTLYHATKTPEAAQQIVNQKTLVSQGEPSVYLSTAREGTGYGDHVVAVNVNPRLLRLDDEFPNGRADFAIDSKSAPVINARFIPVDHDPFGAPLVPVDHDPFGGQ